MRSATTGGKKNEGRGHNGGVWEWTSTVWDKHDGFEVSSLYPGFSADFFDTHHNVVVRENNTVSICMCSKNGLQSLVGRTQRHRVWQNAVHCVIGTNVITRTRPSALGLCMCDSRTLDWVAGQSKAKAGKEPQFCIYTDMNSSQYQCCGSEGELSFRVQQVVMMEVRGHRSQTAAVTAYIQTLLCCDVSPALRGKL
jgi:hypothetical protein